MHETLPSEVYQQAIKSTHSQMTILRASGPTQSPFLRLLLIDSCSELQFLDVSGANRSLRLLGWLEMIRENRARATRLDPLRIPHVR